MARAPVLLVAGARPNFMKVWALYRACTRHGGLAPRVLHTGQHASAEMSGRILADLGLPAPDFALAAGQAPAAIMASRLFLGIAGCLDRFAPGLVVVVGDVTSTAAAAMAALERAVPVAHVEAGLRSFDRAMPEEVNRVLADRASALLFTTEEAGARNLLAEGIADGRVVFAGNVMADTLRHFLPKTALGTAARLGLAANRYALLTVHRAANVDHPGALREIFRGVEAIAKRLPVIFPIHPRTRARIAGMKIAVPAGAAICPPLGYLAFVDLLRHAAVAVTDSGGVQQESALLGVPCVTLRDRTEVPVTVEIGANRLAGTDAGKIAHLVWEAREGPRGGWTLPPRWDGRAAERIAQRIGAYLA
ncbi:MAG: non-hydrolyzing UDP-N-acetylglucosamine 2-epimerase [Myxococcota bacterium]